MTAGPPVARITCPECGIEMNPHAEKPIVPPPDALAGTADRPGELILAVHQCPGCGHVESRRL